MSRGKKIAKENINTEQAAVTNQELLCAIKTVSRYCAEHPHCVRCAMISHCGSTLPREWDFSELRNCGMDKDTLQKAKELERDVKSITRILEEHDKHHWVQVVSPKTDDGQSKRFQNDLAEWLRQQKEIYEKELADL